MSWQYLSSSSLVITISSILQSWELSVMLKHQQPIYFCLAVQVAITTEVLQPHRQCQLAWRIQSTAQCWPRSPENCSFLLQKVLLRACKSRGIAQLLVSTSWPSVFPLSPFLLCCRKILTASPDVRMPGQQPKWERWSKIQRCRLQESKTRPAGCVLCSCWVSLWLEKLFAHCCMFRALGTQWLLKDW